MFYSVEIGIGFVSFFSCLELNELFYLSINHWKKRTNNANYSFFSSCRIVLSPSFVEYAVIQRAEEKKTHPKEKNLLQCNAIWKTQILRDPIKSDERTNKHKAKQNKIEFFFLLSLSTRLKLHASAAWMVYLKENARWQQKPITNDGTKRLFDTKQIVWM